MFEKLYNTLFLLDVFTVTALIAWINLIAVIAIFSFWKFGSYLKDAPQIKMQIGVRLITMVAFLLFALRGLIPDLFSSMLANVLFFTAFSLDVRGTLRAARVNSRLGDTVLLWLTVAVSIIYLVMDAFFMTTALRVAYASLAIIFFSVIYVVSSLISPNTNGTIRCSCIPYVIMIATGVVRLLSGLSQTGITLHTTAVFQSLYYIGLLLHSVFAVQYFFMFLKIDSDRATEKMANSDYLTGLLNRRAFTELGQAAFSSRKEQGKMFSVLFISIDSFHAIGSRHGLECGDEVLTMVARLLREKTHENKLICRYDGGVFGVFLKLSDSAGADLIARRILTEIDSTQFPNDLELTGSIGVYTCTPNNNESYNEFLANGKNALTTAQRRGRHQVVHIKR